jgi:hypothetical protein
MDSEHTQNMVSFQHSQSINHTVAINNASSSISLGIPRELSQIHLSAIAGPGRIPEEEGSGLMEFEEERF